ncbi:MAG: MAPEG family protein [Brevundimonas sp.]|jgi:uncharacterized MAPEG superfamily protein|uniref:MAPEG family protein n=1 Tax=Brevundimonas sp. TaxID=1871086 RepID=UPI00391A7999
MEIIATELYWLGGAVVLGLVILMWSAYAARMQQGMKWAAGPRDRDRPVTGVAARLERAHRNFLETFPYFAVLVVAVVLSERTSALTLLACQLYLGGRVAHVILYALGTPLVRSLAWFVASAGIVMLLLALFGLIGA